MTVVDEEGGALATSTPSPRRDGRRRAQTLAVRRPLWWHELMFIAGSYLLYTLTRNTLPGHEALARHRAVELLHVEQGLHIAIEHSVNVGLAALPPLAELADYYYATLHFLVTIGVLVWLYRRHPTSYRAARTTLYVTNLAALAGFWLFPLAPPRMLPGFVDTVVHFHTWGSWGSSGVARASNEFAAMPSLHVAWAVWCALALWHLARRRWVRWLGAAYPCCTVAVILGTANHFVLDAAGGVVTLAVGFTVSRLVYGRSPFAPASPPPPDAVLPLSRPPV